MTTRRDFLLRSAAAGALLPRGALQAQAQTQASTALSAKQEFTAAANRSKWLVHLRRVAEPVLTHMAAGTLQTAMSVEAAPTHLSTQKPGTYLEAVGRLLCGIAPWLELQEDTDPEEHALRLHFRTLAQKSIARGVDSASHAYLNFGVTRQTLVDSSFLALALLRAPKQLLANMDPATRSCLIAAFTKVRNITPPVNNWLLFSAMNEACLHALGAPWQHVQVETALEKLQSWYLGDGTYGDGPHLHHDFYNSFVMQPYLTQIFLTLGSQLPQFAAFAGAHGRHAERYAIVQERMINMDGSYPVLGRSVAYRCGAFHHLADCALHHALPGVLPPDQVRSALRAVIERTLGAANTYDLNGWLQIGLAGHQPSLGEPYISTGSLYLCAFAFLPLGLPSTDRFWLGEDTSWTAQKIWSGEDALADHAQD